MVLEVSEIGNNIACGGQKFSSLGMTSYVHSNDYKTNEFSCIPFCCYFGQYLHLPMLQRRYFLPFTSMGWSLAVQKQGDCLVKGGKTRNLETWSC